MAYAQHWRHALIVVGRQLLPGDRWDALRGMSVADMQVVIGAAVVRMRNAAGMCDLALADLAMERRLRHGDVGSLNLALDKAEFRSWKRHHALNSISANAPSRTLATTVSSITDWHDVPQSATRGAILERRTRSIISLSTIRLLIPWG